MAQFCVIVTVLIFIVKCNLLKILPNEILNYTRECNQFYVKALRSHLVILSDLYKQTHKRCCYLPFSLSLVYNELRTLSMVGIATDFLGIFTV